MAPLAAGHCCRRCWQRWCWSKLGTHSAARTAPPAAHRADVHELLGADVVGVHQEGAVIGVEVLAQLGVILQIRVSESSAIRTGNRSGPLAAPPACHAARRHAATPSVRHRGLQTLHGIVTGALAFSFLSRARADGMVASFGSVHKQDQTG